MRAIFPGFFQDRGGALALAFGDKQARGQCSRRRERRCGAECFLRQVGGFVRAALALKLGGLRRHQHGATPLYYLVFHQLALVADLQRFARRLPIGGLHREVERVLEWPGRVLRSFQRAFGLRARGSAVATLQGRGHQALASEQFGVFVLEHAGIGAFGGDSVAANLGGARLQQHG